MRKDKEIIDIARQVIDDEIEALTGLKNYIDKNFEEMKEQILNSPSDINEYLDLNRIKNFNLKDSSTLRKNSFQHICTLVNWHNMNNFDKL